MHQCLSIEICEWVLRREKPDFAEIFSRGECFGIEEKYIEKEGTGWDIKPYPNSVQNQQKNNIKSPLTITSFPDKITTASSNPPMIFILQTLIISDYFFAFPVFMNI